MGGKFDGMKIIRKEKDGGPLSRVTGWWLFWKKSPVSIALLRFDPGSREAYHSHAFNSVSWVLSGTLYECMLGGRVERHRAGLRPVITKRSTYHKVVSEGTTWVLTFRGPWARTWKDYDEATGIESTLTHGREVVATRELQ